MVSRHVVARAMAALLVVGSLLGAARPAPAAASTLVGTGGAGSTTSTGTATTVADFGEPFHWLPPLGAEAGDPAKFDASLLDGLIVSICRVEGSACTEVKTLTSASALSERLRIGQTSGKDSYYLANWDVSKVKLEPYTFRVTVTIARLQLATLDVGPATYKSFGRTWPIKFRVEKNPTIRTRVLHEAGKGASQIAAALRLEFGICGDDVAQLLANDLDPFTLQQIDLAIAGACQDAEIWPWTKIADDGTGNALASFDTETGRMVFSTTTPVLANLKAGDVLVGDPAAAAPNGYLRKINSITKNKKTGVITVETRQALLNEAVKDGVLYALQDLKPGDLASIEAGPGVTAANARSGPQRGPSVGGGYALVDIGDGLDFHRTIDVTLHGDASEDGVEGSGTVHIHGRVDFNAGWNVGIGIEGCLALTLACVDRFEAHVNSTMYTDIHVDGTFDGHLLKEVTLETYHFTPIVFFIGPIPVWIVPIVHAIAGIDGTAHVTFSFDAQMSSSFELGAKWTDPDDGGHDWEQIAHFPDPPVDGDAHGDLSATMRLKAYARADAKLLLYGVAGPGAGANIGLDARVQYPGTPLWEIYGFIHGDVNFSVDLGGLLSLGEYRETVLDEDFRLAAAENQPPDCDYRTEPIIIAPGVERYLGPNDSDSNSFQGYFECTDPEGGEVTYSAVDQNDDPVDLSNASWDLPDTYTVHVTARDSAGKTRTFDLTVEVAESTPIVEIITASRTVRAEVQYWVTASAYQAFLDSNDQLVINRLPCSSVVWDVPGATSVTPSPTKLACTIVVVYAGPGLHTITATATGPLGRQGQGIRNVTVTDPPANDGPTIELGSFQIISTDGPADTCSDPSYDALFDCADQAQCPVFLPCPLPVPMEALLGEQGDYTGPYTLNVSATDRFGNVLTPTWNCFGGGFPRPVTVNPDGSVTCDPVGDALSNEILIWADFVDGDGTILHSEVRRMWMYGRAA